MRRISVWISWTLCVCASLSGSAPEFVQDDGTTLGLTQQDGTRTEDGPEFAAEFLRCNKVRVISEEPERIFSEYSGSTWFSSLFGKI